MIGGALACVVAACVADVRTSATELGDTGSSVEPANAGDADPIGFNRDIRPILSKHCIACHGPDEGHREAGLRLDTAEGAHEWAIVAGDADSSDVIDRITRGNDDELRMPPLEHGKRLAEDEIQTLRRWIDQGADYETHWSFVAPQSPTIPSSTTTAANAGASAATPIDAFVQTSLRRDGRRQNSLASPVRLMRRLSLGLTGLPAVGHHGPERTAIDRYLHSPTRKHYGEAVDALLASPSFGEHWAASWLDSARYADTVGYAGDEPRTIWPWRDWVIDAFNADMPFDKFTAAQIAGDLLPGGDEQTRLATAMHRNTLNNNEGGTDDELFRMIAVKDRISTTINVWMGLTMRCAECHSHKYDPISQTEYYQFLDFFNQTADADARDDSPKMPVAVGPEQSVEVPIMQAVAPEKRRHTFVHLRGNPKSRGDEVLADVPQAFHPLPEDAPGNRLDVAHWLTDRNNPLTGRVIANRIWARLFGRGIVETEEDFGTQGMPPSHPELLDHLAVRFMEHGWSVKRLIREMVVSNTYRQSAAASETELNADPRNRSLARGPRFRLTAEQIRDQWLAITGDLSTKMHGPPVYPPSPIKEVANAFKGVTKWEESTGEDRNRRAIYTYLKRSSPHPMFGTFDMDTREVCSLRRFRTNTPLQSLMNLNSQMAIEAAQRLAAAADGVHGDDAVRKMYETAIGESIDETSAATLGDLYRHTQTAYADDRASAKALTGTPDADLAAKVVVAGVILNLDRLVMN